MALSRPVSSPMIADRRRQEMELDPLLLGVLDLLDPGRHLVARAAVDDDRPLRAEPLGRPDGVHGHVAAADDRRASGP